MNPLLELLARNVLGGWITTGVGSAVVWENISAVSSKLAHGESILSVVMSAEGQALLLGIGSIIGRGPDLTKLVKR